MSKLVQIYEAFVDPEKIDWIWEFEGRIFYAIDSKTFSVPVDEEFGWTLDSLVSFVNEQRS